MASLQTVSSSTIQTSRTPLSKTALISIIVPVYNEYYHIENVVQRIVDAPMPEGTRREIVIVDDGSTDGTTKILKQFKDHKEIHVHYSVKNLGKGFAIRAALNYVSGDVVVFQDGDTEYNPNELIKLIEPILSGKAAVVYGSRFMGVIEGMHFRYWLANKLLVGAVRLLYGKRLTDEATAYKGFRADLLHKIPLNCKRFEFCPEVTAKVLRLGIDIHEVPITYSARTAAQGKKIRWCDAVEAFWTLLRYRFWKGDTRATR